MLLSSMRNGFFSAIFLGLLLMGGLGLVLSDWNGMFHGGVAATDVAVIDGTPIKIQDFHTRLSTVLRAQNIDPKDAYQMGLVNAFLRQDILGRLFKKYAEDHGILVDDTFVASRIRTMIAPYKREGVSDKEALSLFLKTSGTTEAKLVETLRSETAAAILQGSLTSASYVPEALAADISAYNDETRDVEAVFTPDSSITLDKQPTDAELQSYYKETQAAYMIPETRSVTVALLDGAQITKDVQVTDDDVASYYKDNKDEFALPETRMIEQVIVPNAADANKIKKLVSSGTSLKDAALKVTGKSDLYTPAKSYKVDDFPSDISAPLFAGKAHDILGPFTTGLGNHVFVINDISPAQPQKLADVAGTIRQSLLADKKADRLFEVTGTLEERLDAGESYESLSKEYALNIKTVSGITTATKADELFGFAGKSAPALLAQAFASEANIASAFKELNKESAAGQFYSMSVGEIVKSAPKAFDTVKEDVRAHWILDQKKFINIARASQKADDLNNGKGTIKKESQDVFNIVQVSRTPDSKTNLPDVAQQRFMDAPRGKFIVIDAPQKGGVYIGRVTKVRLGNQVPDDTVMATLKSGASRSVVDMFATWLQHVYDVRINKDLLEQSYGRKEE